MKYVLYYDFSLIKTFSSRNFFSVYFLCKTVRQYIRRGVFMGLWVLCRTFWFSISLASSQPLESCMCPPWQLLSVPAVCMYWFLLSLLADLQRYKAVTIRLWSSVFINTAPITVTAVICLYYRWRDTSDSVFDWAGAYAPWRKEKWNLCDSDLEANHLTKTECHVKWGFSPWSLRWLVCKNRVVV